MLCDGLNALGWEIEKPEATMFVWAMIPPHYEKSEDFAMDMVKRSGVIVTPGSAFGPSGEGYVRMALVQDEEVLKQAIDAVRQSGILNVQD
ncbi:LL-diaminopimelate aminotransferase [compost metagenome]